MKTAMKTAFAILSEALFFFLLCLGPCWIYLVFYALPKMLESLK